MQDELAARAVERGEQQRRRARRAQQPHRPRRRGRCRSGRVVRVADVQHRALGQRAGDLVRARDHRVGALRQRGRRQRVVEAEVRAPGLVDDKRDAGGVRDVGERRRCRRPCRSRSARRRTRRARRAPRASARLERLGRHAVGDAALAVVLGRHEARQPAAQHEAVDDRRVRVALRDDRACRAARARGTARGCPASRRSSGTTSARRRTRRRRALGALVRRRRRRRGRCRGCPAARRRRARRAPIALRSPGSAPGPPLWPGTW